MKMITGWGNHPRIKAEVAEPLNLEQLQDGLNSRSVLPRGLARSYGDASLNDHVVSMLKCNRIIELDELNGEIECESGVSLAQIIKLILPKGFFLPVTPGTRYVTVGGAIASDVHGKNHHVDGCFSKHLIFFDILTQDGKTQRCSPTQNTQLYYRTIGGMGLSGIITMVRFKLKKVETAYIKQRVIKCRDLSEIMAAFEEHRNATYSVAWLDTTQKGNSIGRSVLLLGEHALQSDLAPSSKDPLVLPKPNKLNLPFFLPSFTINPFTIKVFNTLFYSAKSNVKSELIDLNSYFYPLDAIGNWNRIYGKSGFTQYQFVIPLDRSEEGIREILEYIANKGRSSFLTVLKLFGKADSDTYLSFPIEGYTVAIDFKINSNIQPFIDGLDNLVEKYNGKIYMTKDAFSRLGKKWFETLQQDMPAPTYQNKFRSLMVQRLSKK